MTSRGECILTPVRDLRTRFELSLASPTRGRTTAAVWNMTPSLFASYVERNRTGAVCVSGLASARDLTRELGEGLAVSRLGMGPNALILSRDLGLMDRVADQPTADLWSFTLAVFDTWPEEWEKRGQEHPADIDAEAAPARLRMHFNDGTALIEGPTAEVEQLVTSALLDRVLGGVVPKTWAAPELMAQARATGLLLFRALVHRGDEVRATALHACNFGLVRPLVRKTRRSERVGATEIVITDGHELLTTQLPSARLHSWLGVGRLRLWYVSRGFLSSGDEGWRSPRIRVRAPQPAAPASDPPASPTPRTGSMLILNGRQRAVEAALARKSTELVTFYVGALTAVAHEANPDRFAQAAHGLRELMEKFPKYVDVAMPAHGEKLGAKVGELEGTWSTAATKSKCRQPDGSWAGEIDKPARALLQGIDALFEWKKEHMPRRQAEIAKTLVRLDPAGRPLPAPLQKRNVNLWDDMREYFQKVAHHGYVCTLEEFSQWVEALELFLVERLQPRTFDDFAAIDAIFDEAKRGEDE